MIDLIKITQENIDNYKQFDCLYNEELSKHQSRIHPNENSDIGKLFRTRDNYSEYLNDTVLEVFADGYNAANQIPLPNNWYKLSKVADIVIMLVLINRENIPSDWIKGIEDEIISKINLLTLMSRHTV